MASELDQLRLENRELVATARELLLQRGQKQDACAARNLLLCAQSREAIVRSVALIAKRRHLT